MIFEPESWLGLRSEQAVGGLPAAPPAAPPRHRSASAGLFARIGAILREALARH